MLPPAEQWTHHHAQVNGARLHYVEHGSGPLVVLLHGFPECWYGWRHQIGALAAAGFRVIAPDLRGYNLSEKTRDVCAYTVPNLARDIVELVRHLGDDKATIVGHDWGGAIAWHMAMHHAKVVEKLVILNAPHPATMLRELRKPQQQLKSSYILFFQIPLLPEIVIRWRNFALLRRVFQLDPVRPNVFSPHDIEQNRRALARRGALTCALNYYRALLRCREEKRVLNARRIKAQTLVLWGERDRYLNVGLTHGLEKWVPNLRLEMFPNASHWIHHEEPERVNELMIEFLHR
jgi:pimeloyl-ACP methyl ester carboxylesterase